MTGAASAARPVGSETGDESDEGPDRKTDAGTYLLVVESQGRPDERKRGSWPYYLSYLYEKYRCEPVLIVTTQSRTTAKWASQPIELGFPGWESLIVRPLVLGPDNVPVIADAREAERDVPSSSTRAWSTPGRSRCGGT